MKHLFAIFIPLCIICYIGFGVSLAVLGTKEVNVATDTASVVTDGTQIEVADNIESYEINKPFDRIDIDTAFYDVTIIQSVDADKVSIVVERPDDASFTNDFTAKVSGNTLSLTSSKIWGKGLEQFWKNLAHSIASGDFSDTFSAARVTVTIPEKLYKSLDIGLGSGSLTVTELTANDIDIEMGSGALRYYGRDGFTADRLTFSMGSGKAETYSLGAREYDIDIGSGAFDLNGLCGTGEFDMGSGSGTLGFAEYSGDGDFAIGSGSLTIALPRDANADLDASLGSGKLVINACGVDRTIKDSGNITFGEGGAALDITVGSGRVNVQNLDVGKTVITSGDSIITTTFSENYVEEIAEIEDIAEIA